MKKVLASAGFAALMVASGSASAVDFGMASVVPAGCTVPGAGQVVNHTFTTTAGVIPAGGPSLLATFANASCNTPAKIQVKSARGALTTGANAPIAADPSGFPNHIKYGATAEWNLLTASADANNTVAPAIGTSGASAGPATSSLVVKYTTPGTGGSALMAGSYSDTLTVEILPN
jgi:hypothetical protein